MYTKTIFLDRDGVINKEVSYLNKIEDFEFISGVFDSFRYLQKLGYSLIIVTNQSGIGRGLYQLQDYQILTKWMINEFKKNNIEIKDIFYCPHSPESQCNCRKPNPGMLTDAKIKHNIDMKNSWMIGDKETDIQAANAAGIYNTILIKGSQLSDEVNSSAKYFLDTVKQTTQVINKKTEAT